MTLLQKVRHSIFLLKQSLHYLSVSNAIDIRRAVVGVVGFHFASVEDEFAIITTSVAESNDRPSGKQVCQRVCQVLIGHVFLTYRNIAPAARLTRLLALTHQLLMLLLQAKK